jgi:hypothetical protein
MPTTVRFASDSIFPEGPLIPPSAVTVTYAGPPGLAVWRDVGSPIITTADEMRQFTSVRDSFGRESLKHLGSDPFWNSNDVQRGSIDFRTDGAKHGADLDHDGQDADTFLFRFSDLADVDTKGPNPGVDIWFNGRHVHIDPQANAEVDVFAVRTDLDSIHFRWDSGTDARPDGFALQQPCVQVIDHHDMNPLG